MMVQVANENCQFYQFLRNVVRARLMSNAAGDHLDRGSVPELFVYDVNSSGAMIDAMFQFQGSRRIDCQGDGSGPLLSRVQRGAGPGDYCVCGLCSGTLAAVRRRFSQVSQFSKVHSFLRHSNSHTAMSFGTVWMIWPVIQGHIRRNCSVCIIGNPALELTSSPDNYGTVPFDLL